MTYIELLENLHALNVSYYTQLYGITLFGSNIQYIEPPVLENAVTVIKVAENSSPTDDILLSKNMMKRLIMTFAVKFGVEQEKALPYIFTANAHFMRASILNRIVEVLKIYFKSTKHWNVFHTFDWFQALYVLRNNASHFDNKAKPISFPKFKGQLSPYPDTISWKGIEIRNGQIGDTIRYNDKNCLQLLDFVIEYLESNRNRLTHD